MDGLYIIGTGLVCDEVTQCMIAPARRSYTN